MSDLQSVSDCGDDWETAGDLVRYNTRFAPDTPEWELAQTAVLAGIMHGREQAAREHQAERDRDREALAAVAVAEHDRLRAERDELREQLEECRDAVAGWKFVVSSWQERAAELRQGLARARAANDRLRAALAAVEGGQIIRFAGGWYAGRVDLACRHPTLAAALAAIGLGTGEGEGR